MNDNYIYLPLFFSLFNVPDMEGYNGNGDHGRFQGEFLGYNYRFVLVIFLHIEHMSVQLNT